MKLPWDRDYFKISIHFIVTVVITYFLIIVTKAIFYLILDIDNVAGSILSFIGWIFHIFLPLILACVIAYILDPLVQYAQRGYEVLKSRLFPRFMNGHFFKKRKRKKAKDQIKSRAAGAAIIYILLFLLLFLILFSFVKKMDRHGEDLAENLTYVVNSTIESALKKIEQWNLEDLAAGYLNTAISQIQDYLQALTENIFSKITSVGTTIASVFIGFILGFYFLSHKERILKQIDELTDLFMKEKHKEHIHGFILDLHMVFSSYIRGQAIDAVIMSVLVGIGLSIIKVDFAITIGIITGVANLIPYFGALIGFLLSVSVALFSGSPTKAVYAAIIIIFLQQVDSMIIVPKVVGEKVELSPPAVILALTVFGRLFGIMGMIFAVPLCAVFKMLLTRFVTRVKIKRKAK